MRTLLLNSDWHEEKSNKDAGHGLRDIPSAPEINPLPFNVKHIFIHNKIPILIQPHSPSALRLAGRLQSHEPDPKTQVHRPNPKNTQKPLRPLLQRSRHLRMSGPLLLRILQSVERPD